MDAPERPRCRATTRAGAPCRRLAQPGSSWCRQHAATAEPLGAGPFAPFFTEEERRFVAEFAGEWTAEDALPVLAVAIRRALESGAPSNLVIRACEAYVRALRRGQGGRGPSEADPALEQALEGLGQQLGLPL